MAISTNQAFAMGQPPSSCPNLYDGVITSIIIQSGGLVFDPVLTPGIVIPAQISTGYNMNFTLHTSIVSDSGNMQTGSAWYWNSVYGFQSDNCVYNVGPNQDVRFPTVTVPSSIPYPIIRGPDSWGTSVQGIPDFPGQTNYFIKWQNSPPTSPPPDAPALSATAVSSSQINLSWSAPKLTTGSVVTGYKIERSNDNGTTWNTIIADTNSTDTTYSDMGLLHSITYFYRVSASSLIFSGHPSNWAGATTFNVVPSQPLGLTVSVTSDNNGGGQINLSWSAPADNGGSPIAGYKIERSTDSSTTWITIVQNTNNTATTYSDTGLSSNTTYTYRVSAINSVGTSSSSNTAFATIS